MNSLMTSILLNFVFNDIRFNSGELHIWLIIILVVLFLIFQLLTYIKTSKKIRLFRSIFSDSPRMIKLIVPEAAVNLTESHKILENNTFFKELDTSELKENKKNYEKNVDFVKMVRRSQIQWVYKYDLELYKKAGWVEWSAKQNHGNPRQTQWMEIPFLDVLDSTTNRPNPIFQKILYSINTYLLRNKGAISDFQLVKDIVDRNCDAVDEEINIAITAPLYLGLMGTMFGIIISIGLMTITGDLKNLFVPNPETSANFNVITMLLGGVGLAMISSFFGLIFTMSNSLINYKGAKSFLEKQKIDFFSFIHVELLPLFSQNTASVLQKLESNLNKFNETFAKNNDKFYKTLDNIHTSFSDHKEIISDIRKINLEGLTKTNSELLKEFEKNTVKLKDFNIAIEMVNSVIENAEELNSTLNKQLNRTISIEDVAEKLYQNTYDNKEIMVYISSHINDIKGRTALFNKSVSDLDGVMQKSVENLRVSVDRLTVDLHKHTEESIEKIKKIQYDQVTEVVKNQNLFEKLNHLTNIEEGFKTLSKTLNDQQKLMHDININLVKSIGIKNPELSLKSLYNRILDNSRLVFYSSGALIAVIYLLKQILLIIF